MLKVEVENSAKVSAWLQAVPKSVLDAVAEVVAASGLKVLALAKAKVSGEVLNRRTGTLTRHLNAKDTRSPGRAESTVGIKLDYAAAHEFGSKASGTGDVCEHLRRTKAQKKADIKKGWKNKKSEGATTVRAHKRNWRMNLPERSFLRSALRELRPEILDALNEAVKKGVK
jgi:phage gpG-like protein